MSKITQNYERTKEFLQFLLILLVNTSASLVYKQWRRIGSTNSGGKQKSTVYICNDCPACEKQKLCTKGKYR